MNYKLLIVFGSILLIAACSTEKMPSGGGLPSALKDVPSVRLNFRYEPDVPAPETTEKTGIEERNAAVQADFDQSRIEELIDRTITSPDGKRVAVVYHRTTDLPDEYRLDEFHKMVTGGLDVEAQENHLGKLKIFAGVLEFPARVKCASLSWHTLNAALHGECEVSTE